jgi:uncharacterized protein YjbI with pentapeptide repeats
MADWSARNARTLLWALQSGGDAKGLQVRSFRGASLRGEIFTAEEDLSGADFFEADLSGADLDGASLIDADLTGARLDGVSLRRARLIGARIDRAGMGADGLLGAALPEDAPRICIAAPFSGSSLDVAGRARCCWRSAATGAFRSGTSPRSAASHASRSRARALAR